MAALDLPPDPSWRPLRRDDLPAVHALVATLAVDRSGDVVGACHLVMSATPVG